MFRFATSSSPLYSIAGGGFCGCVAFGLMRFQSAPKKREAIAPGDLSQRAFSPRESHNNGAFALFISGVAGKEERSAKKRRPLAHRKSTQRPFSFFPLRSPQQRTTFCSNKALLAKERDASTLLLLLLINFDTYRLND
jgi:hypothetical protein